MFCLEKCLFATLDYIFSTPPLYKIIITIIITVIITIVTIITITIITIPMEKCDLSSFLVARRGK